MASQRSGDVTPTTRRRMIIGSVLTLGGLATRPLGAMAATEDEITRTSAAIHQTRVFNAAPKRVYDALTDASQFHKVTMLSDAMKGGMPPGGKGTSISAVAGGSFTLFGGVITGRQIEFVPGMRIVQAWRDSDWKPGVFSLVKFELAPQGASTVLTFEHTGFPDADAVIWPPDGPRTTGSRSPSTLRSQIGRALR